MLSDITYILLDAARMGNKIEDAKQANPNFDSLYRGRSEEALSIVAPYLFIFQHRPGFIKWYMDEGWGDSWGILINSSYPMAELHSHFRKFLIVGTEDNQRLYFRFYDPRVLRIFLPTCDSDRLREFFGPIDYFVMEDEDKSFAIKCWLQNGILHSQKIKIEDLISGNVPTPSFQPGAQMADSQKNTIAAKAPSETHSTMQNADREQQQQPAKNKPKWNMFDI